MGSEQKPELISSLRDVFEAAADPVDAAAMKKYMKNRFEFYGIKTPVRKVLYKEVLDTWGMPGVEEIHGLVFELYNQPQRDFHYFAIYLAEKLLNRLPENSVELFEYMLVTNSWWDSVDGIAIQIVGMHFRRFPGLVEPANKLWMESGNIWLQRTCILFQLKYKGETDLDLLSRNIREVSGSKEFFIQKAIGWSLREYSKTDPGWVRQFISTTPLPSLSVREGSKYI